MCENYYSGIMKNDLSDLRFSPVTAYLLSCYHFLCNRTESNSTENFAIKQQLCNSLHILHKLFRHYYRLLKTYCL